MNLHVNLLEKSERRHQSGVDWENLIAWGFFASTILTIVLVLIASGVKLRRVSKMSGLKNEWAQIETKVEALRLQDVAGKANDKTCRMLMHSLDGEHEFRYGLLTEIQTGLHEQIRLTHLFIGQEVGYDDLNYKVLRLQGESVGNGGAMLPVKWRSQLVSNPKICSVAGKVSLEKLTPEGNQHWSFMLKARRLVEEEK